MVTVQYNEAIQCSTVDPLGTTDYTATITTKAANGTSTTAPATVISAVCVQPLNSQLPLATSSEVQLVVGTNPLTTDQYRDHHCDCGQ